MSPAKDFVGKRALVTGAAAVRAATGEFGGLDIAFNVAGAGRSAPILDTAVQDWDFVVDLVQKGVFLSTKHEAKAMLASGAGPGNLAAVVNVASLNAHMPLQRGSSYATAKAGVESFSRNAALELTPLGIRVNVVLPGFNKRILLGRPATPAEIAAPCLFLASDEASYITGTSLVIDGGWEITNYPNLSDYFGS